MHSRKLIVSIVLILFIQQSTSKTKRSKKDPVIHVTRRQSDAIEDTSIVPTVLDDVEDLMKIKGRQPDVDVTEERHMNACPSRCVACDPVNGCTQCRSRTFLYLGQIRHRQRGICLHDCPDGYYGSRGKETNMCKKCQVLNCASCFTSNYCTTCKDGYFLHDAKCLKTCPDNMAPNSATKKCEEKVDCEVGPWSSWSKCARRSVSHSCKYGRKKRTRPVLLEPTENGKQCPKVKESKRCRTPPNKCPLINKWYQRQLRKLNKKKNRKNRKNKGRKGRREINTNDTRTKLEDDKKSQST
nr:R-spondin-2-like [Styela clava]